VVKGRDLQTNDILAVKIYKLDKMASNPEICDIIEEESRILKSLDSPFIIKQLRSFKTASNFYVVYEFCEQGNLYSHIHRKGPLSEKEALGLFRDIVMGVKSLHDRSSAD